jgi:hypothetical protein
VEKIVLPTKADLEILKDGEILGGVTAFSSEEISTAEYCYEILTDEPWAAYSQKRRYKLVLGIYTDTMPEYESGFSIQINSSGRSVLYKDCSVKNVNADSDKSGMLNVKMIIVAGGREDMNAE